MKSYNRILYSSTIGNDRIALRPFPELSLDFASSRFQVIVEFHLHKTLLRAAFAFMYRNGNSFSELARQPKKVREPGEYLRVL